MYTELCEALTWQRPMAEAGRLHDALHRHATRRFDQFGKRFDAERNGDGRGLIGRLRALPDERFAAVIASPQGFYAASPACPIPQAEAYFQGAVAVEEIRLGKVPDRGDRPYWSALGDRSYSVSDDGTWTVDFAAAKLAGFLPVDTRCPATRGELPGVPTKSSPISESDEAATVELLGKAMGTIEATSAVTVRFLTDFARVVVARQTPQDKGFHSAGARITPGRMVMTNALRRVDHVEHIVDGLVHEAIHCAIDHCEFEMPILAVVGTDDMIPSPWTGKPLDLNTFVQACYVWYGLTNFWQQASQIPHLQTEGGRAMLAQARTGFEKADPISTLEKHARVFNPELIDAMQCMRAVA